MRQSLLITAAFGILIASPAAARGPVATGTPATVQRLLGCRSIADNAQRLACYDRETSTVSQAITKKELVLIDKARATAAKRSLFGFSVPDFGGLFGGGGDDVKEITSTVAAFTHNNFVGWTIRLADGSTWVQTDDAQLGLPPKRGQKVVVYRGTLGSFFFRLNGQPGFRVKRIG